MAMPNSKEQPGLALRTARNADAHGIIDLVARCYAEYPGCVLDVDGEEPELRDPERSFSGFWVLERSGRVLGTVACKIHGPDERGRDERGPLELKKLYLDPGIRGAGWARKLVGLIEDQARRRDIQLVELWTDTRFENAHAMYAHLGYTRTDETRELHDRSGTVEYRYEKKVC